MSEGKKIIFALLVILIYELNICKANRSPSILKGALVYSEESHQGPVYLNQNFYTFTRKTDTGVLQDSAHLCRSLTDLYEQKCSEIKVSAERFLNKLNSTTIEENTKESNETHELVSPPIDSSIGDAAAVCKSLKGRLPEIRDNLSKERVRLAMIKNNLYSIKAGVFYDQSTQVFRYESDWTVANWFWKTVYYGGPWTGYDYPSVANSYEMTRYGKDYPVTYTQPNGDFKFKLADDNNVWKKSRILCEIPIVSKVSLLAESEESSPLIQLADHSCKRDMKSIKATTEILMGQMLQITNLNVTVPQTVHNPASFFPQMVDMTNPQPSRAKRTHDREITTESNLQLEVSPQVQGQLSSTVQGEVFERVGNMQPNPQTIIQDDELIVEHTVIKDLLQLLSGTVASTLPSHVTVQMDKIYQDIRKQMRLVDSDFKQWFQFRLEERIHSIPHIERNIEMNRMEIYPDNIREVIADSMPKEKQEGFDIDTFVLDTRIHNLFALFLNSSSEEYKNHPHELKVNSRTERAIPLWVPVIGTFTAGANVINSFITGEAPLSWFGEAFGHIFGLQTKGEALKQNRIIVRTAQAVDQLTVNQQQIKTALNAATQRMNRYSKYILSSHKAIAIITMEQDLKAMIRMIHSTIDATLQKTANIIVASLSGATSPYALTQAELEAVAKKVALEKKIKISTDMADIRMKSTIVDNQLVLIFNSPIIDETQLYHFNRIEALPVFIENKTFMPEIDAKYIAISHSGSEYISMSSDEFSRCTTTPRQCYVTSPAVPLTSQSHCTMVTYRDVKMSCPLVETNISPRPTMHIKDNLVIYSVPTETTLMAKCDNYKTHKPDTAHFKINGMGEISFRPGCTVTLPDGSHFKTPITYPTEDISELKLYELLQFHPTPTNVTLKMFPAPEEDIPEITLNFENISIPSLEDLRIETFHPMRAIPFIIRLMCVAAIVCVILFLVYKAKQKLEKRCGWSNSYYFDPDVNAQRMEVLTNQLKNLQHDQPSAAPKDWNKLRSTSTTALNTIANSMSNMHRRMFRSTSNTRIPTDEDEEKAMMKQLNSYAPTAPVDSQLSIHETSKVYYTPTTPILKRTKMEASNPELSLSRNSVQFAEPFEMGPTGSLLRPRPRPAQTQNAKHIERLEKREAQLAQLRKQEEEEDNPRPPPL